MNKKHSWTDFDKFEQTRDYYDIPFRIQDMFTSKIQCYRFCLKVLIAERNLESEITLARNEITS